jgi:hypothetical protein
VRRVRTNTPLQALTSLNDPYFFAAARALAKRLQLEGGKSLADQIEFGYRLTVGRPPSPSELSKVTAFYDRQLKAYQGDKTAADQTIGAKPGSVPDAPELAALTMLANVLLNMDEALTKE